MHFTSIKDLNSRKFCVLSSFFYRLFFKKRLVVQFGKKGGNLIKLFKPLDVIFILALTFLLVYDYFPNISPAGALPKVVSIALMALILGIFLFSLMFKKFRDNDTNNKEILKGQIFLTIYFLFLIGVFTIFGGRSSSGIAFDNIFLWIFLLISFFDMYSQWKKVKREEA